MTDPCSQTGPQPLARLFHLAEAAFIAEFDRRIAATDFAGLSLAHSRNVLRHLGSGPRRASQVVERCDVSKQAVSQQIVHLERAGYVAVAPDPSDARARVLELTDKGRRAQDVAHELFAQIEADWASALGERDLGIVQDVLTRLLETYPARASC